MKRITLVVLAFFIAGCTSVRSLEYYEHRDSSVVTVLGNCSSLEVEPLKEGSRVKDLAVSYVDVKSKLKQCQVVVEEVVGLIGVLP